MRPCTRAPLPRGRELQLATTALVGAGPAVGATRLVPNMLRYVVSMTNANCDLRTLQGGRRHQPALLRTIHVRISNVGGGRQREADMGRHKSFSPHDDFFSSHAQKLEREPALCLENLKKKT